MAIVDKKTPRLGLLLPNADNFLQDDVERLIQSFDLLDVLVVMRDQNTGKIADDQLSAVIARLDAQGKIATSALPSSVVQKGADGKIDASVLPSIAIIDSFPVPNEASMLGLQCERGDIAIRTDLGRSFILTDLPPSKLSNWRELTSTNVTSVNGQVGAITGLAKSGANDDITSLNALSGPLRLGGEAAGDYDAVTLKQLRAASGGAGGASMNGVMNNFIGAVEWFNGSRAKIPAGYIAADGQECSQTDPATADLYAAVSAGLFATVTEALWQNSGNADTLRKGENRGKYVAQSSTGKFRVPDLNGATTDGATPGANFLRGDGGGRFTAEIGDVGAIKYNAAPNITASTSSSVLLGGSTAGQVGGGAFTPKNSVVGTGKTTTTGNTPITYMNPLDFNASLSNAAYGRGTEVRPNSVTGIWIIRASGTFTAQNTAFNVINGDTAAPANNTVVAGGYMVSAYQIGGLDRYRTRLFTQAKYGVNHAAVLAVENLSVPGTVSDGAYYQFGSDGLIDTGRNVSINMGVTNNLTITANGNNTIFAADGTLKSTRFQAAYAPTGWNDWYMTPGNPAPFDFPTIVGTGDNAYLLMAHRASRPDGWPQRVGFGHYVRSQSSNSFGFGVIQLTGDNGNWARFQFNMNGQIDGARQYNNGTTEVFTYAMSIVSDRNIKDDVTYVSGEDALTNIEAMDPVTFIFKRDENRRLRRGFIAQDLEKIDPQYVKDVTVITADGKDSVTTKTLDNNVLLLDALAAIKVLSARVKLLESAQK
jgi:hypothetical protein|nr:MAG TPA: receptor binding complex [Herelleviridae sp.]